MDAKITKIVENPVIGRKEVSAIVNFDKATPTRQEMKELVCSKIGANPDSAVLRKVISKFGQKSVDVLLHIYGSKEEVLKNEPNFVLVRDKMAEKKVKKEKKKGSTTKK